MSTDAEKQGKKMLRWVFLFVSLLLVVSLSKGIFELLAVYDRVEEAEMEVAELQAKKMSLERQLEERQSEGFLERQIRNKLHLSRPGDTVVMLPEDMGRVAGIEEDDLAQEELENWEKWVNLVF